MIFRFTSQLGSGRAAAALDRLQRQLVPRSGRPRKREVAPEGVELMPLSDLSRGQRAIVDEIMLSGPALDQVMLFGFIPGVEVVVGYAGPGGDPRVYRVDGTEVAVRRETASHILVRPLTAGEQS